jgi:alanyl-tRNA synthetase
MVAMIGHRELRTKITSFWQSNDHKLAPPIPLVPQNDPTTLFTGSGMQQFVPYLLGEKHPLGNRVFNIQPCLRSQDIEEVGDNRHTTFFEMIGNWSFGDYFKREQLPWIWDFLTNTEYGLGIDPHKLYVSVFTGSNEIAGDVESVEIWKKLYAEKGIEASSVVMGSEADAAKVGMQGGRIFAYDAKKNWWSRAGVPENMPAGEPGGPDSEIFYEFTQVEHDPAFGEHCHPNCDCGRFLEIGNSVFMQYKRNDDGSFSELPKPNVDFGGGLERQLAAITDNPDVFTTELFQPIIKKIEALSGKSYQTEELQKYFRIITDHIKGAVMLISIDIYPSNKEQGYVVRRMLRRAIWMGYQYLGIAENFTADLVDAVVAIYGDIYTELEAKKDATKDILHKEESKFRNNLMKGMREVPKIAERYSKQHAGDKNQEFAKEATGEMLFFIYESFGFPPDLTVAMLEEQGWSFTKTFTEEFEKAKKAHADKSRAGAEGKFKGGLADNSEQVIKYHTATHLLHQALFDVLGSEVRQEGSNITGERLRFDFKADHKPTPEEVEQITAIVNEKIQASLPVTFQMLPKEQAEQVGAKSFFKEKYPDTVKVYFIGEPEHAYSKEFCGGPHVQNTGEIGSISIKKVEKIGSNIFRLYAQ